MKSFEAILRSKIEGRNASPLDPGLPTDRPNQYPSLSPWVDLTIDQGTNRYFHGKIKKVFLKQRESLFRSEKNHTPQFEKVKPAPPRTSPPSIKPLSKDSLIFLKFEKLSHDAQASYTSIRELGAHLPKAGSDWHTLKKEYRRLAKDLHPDGNNLNSDSAAFIRLSRAYRTLNNFILKK